MLRSCLASTKLSSGARLLGKGECFSTQKILALNDLSHNEGAVQKRKRWGRGIGSGRGKNCGYGHQYSPSTPRAFEGGQTPLYKRLPKIGFNNVNKLEHEILNLYKIQEFIDMGRLTPKADGLITMRDLLNCGIISQIRDGVKLLAKGKSNLRTPIHLEVCRASESAIAAVEAVGGTVTTVHFNRLALRALTKPLKFELFPRRARPQPKAMAYYLDKNKAGYLSPEVQIRNMKLFGAVTSERAVRDEHEHYMELRREEYKEERLAKRAIMAEALAEAELKSAEAN